MKKITLLLSITVALLLLNCSKPKPEQKNSETPTEITMEQILSQINTSEVFFNFDESNLSSNTRNILKTINGLLSEFNASNIKVTIEGHTDALGTISYNLALGESRAQSVLNYLTQLGIDQSKLSVISYGEESLKINTDEREPLNRRVSFSASSN